MPSAQRQGQHQRHHHKEARERMHGTVCSTMEQPNPAGPALASSAQCPRAHPARAPHAPQHSATARTRKQASTEPSASGPSAEATEADRVALSQGSPCRQRLPCKERRGSAPATPALRFGGSASQKNWPVVDLMSAKSFGVKQGSGRIGETCTGDSSPREPSPTSPPTANHQRGEREAE